MKEKIKKYPDRILREVSLEVEDISKEKDLVLEMKEVLSSLEGLGLAAIQIGEKKRVVVIKEGEEMKAFFNPKITYKSKEKIEIKEGCLSLPGIWATVERPAEIEVRALNEEGKKISFSLKGVEVAVMSHELDHLDGKLFIDYLSARERIKLLSDYFFKKDESN